MYLSQVTYPGAITYPGGPPVLAPNQRPGGGPTRPMARPLDRGMGDYEAPIDAYGRVRPSPRAGAVLLQSGAMAARAFLLSSDGSTRTPLPLIAGGSVTADGKSLVRRTASIQVLGVWGESLRTMLAPFGTRVQVQRGVRVATNAIEWMTLITAPIWETSQTDDEKGEGPLSLSLKDEMAMVARVKFDQARTTWPTRRVTHEIRNIITQALPLATVIDLTGSLEQCGKLDLQQDRGAAVEKLATAIGAECYAGRGFQTFYIVPVPTVDDAPRWALQTGPDSNVATITRKRSADKVYNRVVAVGEAPDTDGVAAGPAPWAVAEITSQADPLHVTGPFGRSTYNYASPALKTVQACQKAADKVLARVRGADTEVSFTSLVNPAADPGDVFESYLTDGVRRLHIADTIDYPLGAADAQSIPCRTRDFSDLEARV